MGFIQSLNLYKMWDRLTDTWQLNLICGLVFNWLLGEYNAGLGALFSLVILDLLTKLSAIAKESGGFWIAWKTDAISSHGLRDGAIKVLQYICLVIAAHQIGQFSVFHMTIGSSAIEIMCAYLGCIEFKSMLENLRDAGMKHLGPLIIILGEKQDLIVGHHDEDNDKE